jgi:diadenosine tetraphosphate (Ap4A) HIT family hydrolase
MDKFILDPTLQEDSFFVADLPLSQLLLMNDARYPWLILVPRRANKAEIMELLPEDQQLLLTEINLVSSLIKNTFSPDKINIANIGNRVRALHIHAIARYKTDEVWPAPVWGLGESILYSVDQKTNLIITLRDALNQ